MNNVEKIKAEIERLKEHHKGHNTVVGMTYNVAYDEILSFIESMTEETGNDDLERAADNCYFHNHAYARESFIEGANWQKAQLLAGDAMKEVKGSFGGEIKVDLYAKLDNGGYIDFDPGMKLNPACGVKIGNRVRIIVMED